MSGYYRPVATELDAPYWANRIYDSQKLGHEVYLHGDPKPTRNQVAAVLHAMADHTGVVNMLAWAGVLGADRESLGEGWVESTGIGRYLQRLGDALEVSMHEGKE